MLTASALCFPFQLCSEYPSCQHLLSKYQIDKNASLKKVSSWDIWHTSLILPGNDVVDQMLEWLIWGIMNSMFGPWAMKIIPAKSMYILFICSHKIFLAILLHNSFPKVLLKLVMEILLAHQLSFMILLQHS